MLKDPEMLRRTMQAASDPAAMRSMLQQQDRTLFNVLAQPGGENALKRLTNEGTGDPDMNDALIEQMRLEHLPPEQDEHVLSIATLRFPTCLRVYVRVCMCVCGCI